MKPLVLCWTSCLCLHVSASVTLKVLIPTNGVHMTIYTVAGITPHQQVHLGHPKETRCIVMKRFMCSWHLAPIQWLQERTPMWLRHILCMYIKEKLWTWILYFEVVFMIQLGTWAMESAIFILFSLTRPKSFSAGMKNIYCFVHFWVRIFYLIYFLFAHMQKYG